MAGRPSRDGHTRATDGPRDVAPFLYYATRRSRPDTGPTPSHGSQDPAGGQTGGFPPSRDLQARPPAPNPGPSLLPSHSHGFAPIEAPRQKQKGETERNGHISGWIDPVPSPFAAPASTQHGEETRGQGDGRAKAPPAPGRPVGIAPGSAKRRAIGASSGGAGVTTERPNGRRRGRKTTEETSRAPARWESTMPSRGWGEGATRDAF